MDCTEVFFKLLEIPIAAIAAGATAVAGFFAYRAFQAQAAQLRALEKDRKSTEEDRLFEQLAKSPRFVINPTGTTQYRGADCKYELVPVLYPDRANRRWMYKDVDYLHSPERRVWFRVDNTRKHVGIERLKVLAEDGSPAPLELYAFEDEEGYFVIYPDSLVATSCPIKFKIYFETTEGFEGVHTYETIPGQLDFRRVHPPSIIDSAGV